MTTRPLDPAPDSIFAQIRDKTSKRPKVDANGHPIDPNAPRRRFTYDAKGQLIEVQTASNEDT